LIGWTGEIMPKVRRPWERKAAKASKKPIAGVVNGQLDDLPTEETTKTEANHDFATDLVSLTKADKQKYEEQLKTINRSVGGKNTELVPIWTLEDADEQPKGTVGESAETQSRFRKYAEQGISSQYESNCSPLAVTSLRPMDRNGRKTRNQMVERLCQTESTLCSKNP
jgi:hypothetical protein